MEQVQGTVCQGDVEVWKGEKGRVRGYVGFFFSSVWFGDWSEEFGERWIGMSWFSLDWWRVRCYVSIYIPMPICFAFSCAASEAILAASRESVGRLFVTDIVVIVDDQ